MKQRVVAMVLAASATAGGVSVHSQNAPSAIRPEAPAIRSLIDRGLEQSETFRDLVRVLDTSDVVVYVRFSRCTGRVPACLLWASGAAGTRRLLIKIDPFGRPGRSENDLTALLAHELQHAAEVASAPAITDVASFQEWFGSHGRRLSPGFETGRAVEVGRKVMAELLQQAREAEPLFKEVLVDLNRPGLVGGSIPR
jgi:hypothetical protein